GTKSRTVASAQFLKNDAAVDAFLTQFKQQVQDRLNGFYTHFQDLHAKGYPVDCIQPQSAIYLTVRCDLRGKTKPDGTRIETMADVAHFLLHDAKIALVPFYAFGTERESPWFRLSVGTCSMEDVHASMASLEKAMSLLG
ncbi:MAG TPA: aminotransferase class I/II-fold pyridoxal phosphate-dependent enzyme, partial [Chitinophagales bacterium]|nr:aminotransferase class I/II-fold pyridoxal phosphate-dependent enzyme [Chitinophagales bacterium]